MKHWKKAFTLVELILVMTIIVIMTLLVAPAFTSILKGNDITNATEILTTQLNLARMQAISKNRQVQVRIYSYADPNIPGENPSSSATWNWHALQIFELDPGGVSVPNNKVQKLPNTAVIDYNTNLSTILPTAANGRALIAGSAAGSIPAVGTNYNYASFIFNPDGSTDLSPGSQWFLTVRNINSVSTGSTPPANFATVQVDPLNGTTLIFRPGR